ncbi:MAG: V-type ATP synthase subunit E [Candidatus Hodarchaeales archaeon]|jgi:V/A-type H+-transporting ATPase subunit E
MTETNHFENEILQDAKEQAKNILLEAKQEVAKILDQARSEQERIFQAKRIEIEKEEEQKAQRELSKLRIKNKIEINNVKDQLLDKIFTKSLERIQEWNDKKSEEYRSTLSRQIIQGGVSLEGGELIVKIAPEDVPLIDIKNLESEIANVCGINTTIKISAPESDAVDGGSIINKGFLSVHNTIEARFDRKENILRDEVHRILFIS